MTTSSQLLHAERQLVGATVYDYCVRTHLWVASAVTTLALFACRRLDCEPSLGALAIVFFATLLIYNLDTTLDLRGASTSSFAGDDLSRQQSRAAKLTFGSLIGLVAVLATTNWLTVALVVSGAGVCCLYAVPLGPRRFTMKALPGAKSLVVGGAVAIAVVTVPVAEQGLGWGRDTWITLGFIATLTTVNATLFDVRDLEHDGRRGLRTLPVVLGLGWTRALLATVLLVNLVLLSSYDPTLHLPAWTGLAVFLPLIARLGPRSPRAAYAWLVDGALLLPWLLTLSV